MSTTKALLLMNIHPQQVKQEANILELQSLENFLISVERRAFRIAMISLAHREDALDAVQEAMTQLVTRYADKAWDEWRPLFYRILNSKIIDIHRKRKLQQRFNSWFGAFRNDEDEGAAADSFDNAPDPNSLTPEQQFLTDQNLRRLEDAIMSLPRRQQQAFMLRCWEGLSTIETAQAMKCSEGSVKTHYSRAMHHLKGLLRVAYE